MSEHTAADYRAMAQRALARAEKTKDPAIRASLIDIAARYACMADLIENRAVLTDAIVEGKPTVKD